MSKLFRRMSSSFRALAAKMGMKEECNILILGLDNSGKSTMINYLQSGSSSGEIEETVPTVGYRVETFRRKNLSFTAYDMSGQGKYRNLWSKQFSQVHGIIFVVDSTDKMRLCVAKDELEMVLEDGTIKESDVPILFLANKRDHPDHMSPADCVNSLGLENIQDRPWFIVATNARTGEGVEEALDWLADNVISKSVEEKSHK